MLMLQAAFTFYDKLKAFDDFEYGYTLKVPNERPAIFTPRPLLVRAMCPREPLRVELGA